jgi:tetratricopeptide (TPR) repeat protein
MPFLLLWTALQVGCASRTMRTSTLTTYCTTAGSRLNQAWRALSEALKTPGGCEQDKGLRCDALRSQIDRLSVDCPGNPDVVMANALLAFDARNFVRAQQLLDELFSLGVSNPEAAVLRIRIALEQGNTPFALRFAEQQVRQRGDDAGLRESYASALYLAGRWDDARVQLSSAQQFGAPAWRIAYAQGLVAEAEGKLEDAKLRYQEALRSRPDWKAAESRLRALMAQGRVSP